MQHTKKQPGAKVSAASDQTSAAAAEALARDILNFGQGKDKPDWLNDMLVDAVADMAAHFQLPNPFAEPHTAAQIAPLARLIERAGPLFSLRNLPSRRPLLPYHPTIAARRPHYQRQAEALIQLLALQSQQVDPLLDLEPQGVAGASEEHAPHILSHAIDAHLAALCEDVLGHYTDAWLRTFYVELRLFYDEERRRLENPEPPAE